MARISKADILNENLSIDELRRLAGDLGIPIKGLKSKRAICEKIASKIDLETTKRSVEKFIKRKRRKEKRAATELIKGVKKLPKTVKELISLVQQTPLPKIKAEPQLEDNLYPTLKGKFPNLTKQGGTVNFFGFDHRPDYVVNNIAIELKTVKGGNDVQVAIGQGVIYRQRYEHVVLILYDLSKGKKITPKPEELKELAKQSIYVTMLK